MPVPHSPATGWLPLSMISPPIDAPMTPSDGNATSLVT
jgi:hypothetical protein